MNTINYLPRGFINAITAGQREQIRGQDSSDRNAEASEGVKDFSLTAGPQALKHLCRQRE